MIKITNRISHYLIARQRRAARHEAFEQAAEAEILESKPLGESDRNGKVWKLTADQAAEFSGDPDRDRDRIRAALEASTRSSKYAVSTDEADELSDRSEFGDPDELSEVGEAYPQGQIEADKSAQGPGRPGGEVELPADFASGNPNMGSGSKGRPKGSPPQNGRPQKDLAARRNHVLSIVYSLAPRLKPAEVTTALLLANAVGRDDRLLDQLLSVIKSKTSIIAVQIPVHDFVREFGLMLEQGLILPFYTSLGSIGHTPTLSGRHKALADSKRRKSFECLKGSLARRLDDEELRQLVSKHVLGQAKPVIIADATGKPLPSRLVAAADIVIEGKGIDASLIADVLAICCDIPVTRSWFLMNELAFEPQHLGIDDLAVAIRAGRSLKRMIGLLMTLEAENAANFDDEDNDSKKAGGLNSTKSSAKSALALNRKKYAGCFEVIEPLTSAEQPKSGNPSKTSKLSQMVSGKDHLLVEKLTGYGEARQWALDLKADLQAFENEEVAWSELSSRLLLSGPPGTGKTTFARALCNTLELPLIATSVARWLEASHLGDVLAAIGATFDHVSQNAPCILFIDEIDNIGNRSGGGERPYDDYWSSLVNRLLELLDGASKTLGVIIVGATNRPEKIDPALLRSGRLEKHIIIPPPDTKALIGIIAHHLGSDLNGVLNSKAGNGMSELTNAAATKTAMPDSVANDDGSTQSDNPQKGVTAHG